MKGVKIVDHEPSEAAHDYIGDYLHPKEIRAKANALRLPNSAIVFLFDDVSPKDGLDPVATAINLLNAIPSLLDALDAAEQALAGEKARVDIAERRSIAAGEQAEALQAQIIDLKAALRRGLGEC